MSLSRKGGAGWLTGCFACVLVEGVAPSLHALTVTRAVAVVRWREMDTGVSWTLTRGSGSMGHALT